MSPAGAEPAAGYTAALDADRDDLLAQHAELERRLDALRGSACRGAK